MEKSGFLVDIDSIPTGGLERCLVVEDAGAEGIALAVAQSGPLKADVCLTKHGSRIFIKGAVDVPVLLGCSRCLSEYPHEVHSEFEACLQAGERIPLESDHQLSTEEMEVAILKDGAVDLRELIAEQVHLALPVKPLCVQTCKGLCPHCGRDLNVESCSCTDEKADSRWEVLKKLKTE